MILAVLGSLHRALSWYVTRALRLLERFNESTSESLIRADFKAAFIRSGSTSKALTLSSRVTSFRRANVVSLLLKPRELTET